MKNKWLLLLLVLTFIKGTVWVILTPIFQVPDENVHWGMVQFVAEKLKIATKKDIVTSAELSAVAQIIRFNWVESHPVWHGFEENWVEKLNQISNQTKSEFVLQEKQGGHKLAPLYYWLGGSVYRLLFNQSFLVRFYASRFLSVILSLATVYLSFLTARVFFKPNLSLAVAFMVAMQPMYSVISSAVTYDAGAVLAATVFIYLSLLFIKTKKTKWLWLSLLVSIIGITIKYQLVALLAAWVFLLNKKQLKYLLILPAAAVILWRLRPFQQLFDTLPTFSDFTGYFTANWRSLWAEVFPWYWGVFGWLEKTMPLWVYRILKIITGLSLIGLLRTKLNRQVIYLIIVTFVLAMVIFINDFLIFAQRGSGFGVQGRYFIPAITADMILLVLGLSQLVKPKKEKMLVRFIIIGSIGLNLIGLYSLHQYFGWFW